MNVAKNIRRAELTLRLNRRSFGAKGSKGYWKAYAHKAERRLNRALAREV